MTQHRLASSLHRHTYSSGGPDVSKVSSDGPDISKVIDPRTCQLCALAMIQNIRRGQHPEWVGDARLPDCVEVFSPFVTVNTENVPR